MREADELREALDESRPPTPQPGEDDELAERADRLSNLEELRLAARRRRALVSAGDSATTRPTRSRLVDARDATSNGSSTHDQRLAPIAEALRARASCSPTPRPSRRATWLGSTPTAPANSRSSRNAERCSPRWSGATAAPSMTCSSSAARETAPARTRRRRRAHRGLESSVEVLTAEVDRLAARLTELRSGAAERLGAAVTAEFAALAMPDARLLVSVDADHEPSAHGRDHVTIMLQPHAGAEPRPVSRGASGGELSRVMLAIEVVIAGSDPVPTFVFDEVDAGVGGAAATEIGRRLARLAERSQVIVVTHLAQVAAFATNHLSVVKGTDGQVTSSSVRQLSGVDREAEMARLLSGLSDSESGLAHARELLEIAADRAA